jgi:cell division protein FtsZ
MSITLTVPKTDPQLRPRITVIGVGGAGGNAVNNMINAKLEGVDFVVANTDSQALAQSLAERKIQLGINVTHGLGAGARPDVGRAAAEEALDEITEQLRGAHMAFITAGMGGGTGTGAAPVIARIARDLGVLTIGVVTKPFQFEGSQRAKLADAGIEEMQQYVDTLIIIPNQNLFRVANEKTTFADAFAMADEVLHSGVRGVTDLMVVPGLINLDFADIRSVMTEMGKAMMGTGEASGENRAREAAEAAISNPLLDDVSMKGAKGVLINITGGPDLTLYEVDEAANRIGDEVDDNANIIFGSTLDPSLEGQMRVSVVATGIDAEIGQKPRPVLHVVADPFAASASRDGSGGGVRPSGATASSVQTATLAARAAAPAPAPAASPSPALSTVERAEAEPFELKVPVARPAEPESAPEAQSEGDRLAREIEARTEAAGKPFVPAPPIETSPHPVAEARPSAPRITEPVAPAQPAGPAVRPARERSHVSSLFSRMTGRARPEPRPEPRPASPPPQPAASPVPPVPRAPEASGPHAGAARNEPEQPTLANLDGGERLRVSQSEEDLLEIPAFLRRQAN